MSFLFWFQDLPGWLALLLVFGYFGGFALLLTWLGRKLTAKIGLRKNPGSIGTVTGAIGTMVSILIGLVIVSLWNDYKAARTTVSLEATELRGAARDVQLLAPTYRGPLLDDLRRYTRAVTNDDWPAMERGDYANSAGRALAQLTVDANGTRTASLDLRARVSRIAELRRTRLAQTTSGVVWVLWIALLTIPIVLFAGLGLLNDECAPFQYICGGLVAVAASLAIFVALEIDLPYRGIAAISPDSIDHAVEQALGEAAQQPN
jgi:hypothetical protein